MTSYILRESSIEGELYYSVPGSNNNGALPGQMQYHMSADDLYYMDVANYVPGETEYRLVEHSSENMKRLVPNTQMTLELGQSLSEWKCLLIMQATRNGPNFEEIWLKGAMLHRRTGEIMLMTSTNHKSNWENRGNQWCHSTDPDWYIGRCRMCAPIQFWRELKNRVEFSL
jgi:hypothetical protein